MNVYKIPDNLTSKYKGSGYAFAASLNGILIDIRYLVDIFDEIPDTEQGIALLIRSDVVGPIVRELQSLGDVHFGMCSCWEFCEL